MDGLVVQSQSLGQPRERYSDVVGHLLGVNAPGRLVVQLGESDLESPGATKESLHLLLEDRDALLHFGGLLQELLLMFNCCCWHDLNLHKISALSTNNLLLIAQKRVRKNCPKSSLIRWITGSMESKNTSCLLLRANTGGRRPPGPNFPFSRAHRMSRRCSASTRPARVA